MVDVLVVNVGSSGVKLSALDATDRVIWGTATDPLPDVFPLLGELLGRAPQVDAVGHRIVHGGSGFPAPVVIDDEVEQRLDRLGEIAPLHNTNALNAVRLARDLLRVPHVACFDTSFHTTLPAEAYTYAIPRRWREEYGIRRFGFHGLSHAYAARRTAELLGAAPSELRVVTCHLGSGASLAAVLGGRSVDTTMGFTPLEGLVMATRSGDVDPAALLWLQRQHGFSPDEISEALERESGLRGLAGGDIRYGTLLEEARRGDSTAATAAAVYEHRLAAGIAAMSASLGGIDAVTFTGGVGENEPELRVAMARRLSYLGLKLDSDHAAESGQDRLLSSETRPAIAVVHAREDLEIARHVRALVAADSTRTADQPASRASWQEPGK